MNSTLQPQSNLLSSGVDFQSLQPTALTNQFSSGTMQGQLLNNSPLLVQPQTAQQPISLKSQTLTPSKPLNASGKPVSELIADSTPLHQVFVAGITFLTGHFLDHKRLRGGWKLYTVACVLCAKYSCYINFNIQ